jgi:TetR/AcrR family transcriptional repressor of nem operon
MQCKLAAMTKSQTIESSDVRENILAVGQRIMSGKGFSAVGLNEILTEAKVPKGSFYHYFGSKDAFGEALLANYFDDYLADIDRILGQPGLPMAARLLQYFDAWRDNQSFLDCQGKCLAVKLAAEVADLSEAMRAVLNRGTADIIAKLALAIEAGMNDGSLSIDGAPKRVAESLYQLWLGASVMVKIVRNAAPFDAAMAVTRQMMHLKDTH